MTQEEEAQIISHIASTIMNRLTIHGLIEASKFYSIEQAKLHYEELPDKEKQEILDNVKKGAETPQNNPQEGTLVYDQKDGVVKSHDLGGQVTP